MNAPIDPLRHHLGYALRRASAALMAQLAQRFAALDLRPSEATVLMVIDSNPGINPSAIGRMLDIAKANVTPLIARLDERGLLERSPVNGRSHSLRLTSTGRALTKKLQKVVATHETELLLRIPEKQRTAFLTTLQALWHSD